MKGATGDFYVDDTLIEQVTDAKVVHIGGIGLTETMDRRGRNAELMRLAKSKGAITTLDVFATSPDDMKAVAEVLPHVDYFLPSIEEARALSGIEDMEEAARYFLNIGVRCCVFTLGGDGAYYRHSNGTRFTMPAFDVDVKCTCGCGDAFNAGFAVGLCREMSPENAVRFAQATSALNATGLGSQAGVQSFEHTWAFMQSTPVKQVAAQYAIAG
jgi:sugar/nucleoside kinase (ribokinase family)